jgi:hypothetical protein
MSNLRYATASADGTRLYDSVEERYFITEKKAVDNLNEKLERAAQAVLSEPTAERAAERVRALKENL